MIEGGRESAKAGAQAPEPSGEQPAWPCGAFPVHTIGSRDGRHRLARVSALRLDPVLPDAPGRSTIGFAVEGSARPHPRVQMLSGCAASAARRCRVPPRAATHAKLSSEVPVPTGIRKRGFPSARGSHHGLRLAGKRAQASRGIEETGKAGPEDCGQRLPALPARRRTKPRFSHGAQADNEDPNPLAVRPGTIGRRDA